MEPEGARLHKLIMKAQELYLAANEFRGAPITTNRKALEYMFPSLKEARLELYKVWKDIKELDPKAPDLILELN